MSPDMLTLVAEVLATDLVFDSVLHNDRCDLLSSRSMSRNAMSETRDEKDMVAIGQRRLASTEWGGNADSSREIKDTDMI